MFRDFSNIHGRINMLTVGSTGNVCICIGGDMYTIQPRKRSCLDCVKCEVQRQRQTRRGSMIVNARECIGHTVREVCMYSTEARLS